MQRKVYLWVPVVVVTALVAACGGDQKPANPTTPSASMVAGGPGAAADDVTLKVNAPALTSPVGGARLTEGEVTLTFQAATAKYVTGEAFAYRVQLMNASSAVLEEKTGTATSYKMSTPLDSDTLYRWRVRAEQQGQAGPWSATESFRSMERPSGYIRNDEVYDPLIDGRTVGMLNGAVTFVPGVGAMLETFYSNIEYHIPQTITRGEFSCIITNLTTGGPGGKTKVFSMAEGSSDLITNDRRMTVEKRADGTVAWRFITQGDQVDTEGPERIIYGFRKANTYFWKATWDGTFRVQIHEGGVSGPKIYDMGKGYDGPDYDPNPHYAWAGGPIGRSGPDAGTVPGMTIRQIWISSRPRPSWANQ